MLKTRFSPPLIPRSRLPRFSDRTILVLIWLAACIFDISWNLLNKIPPDWDQGDHLTRAVNYWGMFQNPDFFDGEWWTKLWRLSPSFRAPFVYLMTVPFLSLFGLSHDSALLVNLLFTAIILVCIYQLGKHIFTPEVGLWTAGLCILAPVLILNRTSYLLEYGLTATVIFAFTSLTFWRDADEPSSQWFWSLSFGFGVGMTLFCKPTGLLLLFVPTMWVFVENLFRRNWGRIFKIIIAFILAGLILFPWVSLNWLTILTTSNASNNNGTLYESDPSANTLSGWLYYLKLLPEMISPLILYIGLGCGLLALGFVIFKNKRFDSDSSQQYFYQRHYPEKSTWRWLVGFCLGAYILFSLLSNKDPRFILPYIPVVVLLLARCLTLWSTNWSVWLRWCTAVLTSILLIANFFPVPVLQQFGGKHLPYTGTSYPNQEAIAEVIKSQPYLRSNIGVVVNTPQVNPFNLDFYGNAANFQVYSRQLGFNEKSAALDARSLNWYLTVNNNQGAIGGIEKANQAINQAIAKNGDLEIAKTWTLPDKSELRLHKRRVFPVVVEKLKSQPAKQLRLKVDTVEVAPPGQVIPVKYEFTGNWQQLHNGLVLLTWKGQNGKQWFNDHAIALGNLHSDKETPASTQQFRVVENIAMRVPRDINPGTYKLQATYIYRPTGETSPISLTSVELTLDNRATAKPAPEPDLVTKLYGLGEDLSRGKLDPIFQQIGWFNQYDPIQDYLVQAEQALTYRLEKESKNLKLLYPLALSQTLQRRVPQLLDTLEQITQLDAKNAYAWTYLGFVNLYNFQPQAAQTALEKASRLNSKISELKTLKIVSQAMQFNFKQAWELYKGTGNGK